MNSFRKSSISRCRLVRGSMFGLHGIKNCLGSCACRQHYTQKKGEGQTRLALEVTSSGSSLKCSARSRTPELEAAVASERVRIPFTIPAPGTRPFDVVGFGLNSTDLLTVVAEFPVSNSKQRLQRVARMPGGQIATAMVTCARLGWRARYIGSFGDDEF